MAKENGKIEVVVNVDYFNTMERYNEYEQLGLKRQTLPYMEYLCEHKIIQSWSLEGSPHDINRLLALHPREWKQVNEQVVGKINKLFQD